MQRQVPLSGWFGSHRAESEVGLLREKVKYSGVANRKALKLHVLFI